MAFYSTITQTTRDMLDGRKPPRVNMTNGKPYRTASQKRFARDDATQRSDGTWRTSAPVSFHPPVILR